MRVDIPGSLKTAEEIAAFLAGVSEGYKIRTREDIDLEDEVIHASRKISKGRLDEVHVERGSLLALSQLAGLDVGFVDDCGTWTEVLNASITALTALTDKLAALKRRKASR